MNSNPIKNRYDFVILYDVENGNPNGDPDAGNMPRLDPETSHGIVTDVCIKRKIRNYVDLVQADKDKFDIYIKQDRLLNDKDAEGRRDTATNTIKAMCGKYYDIRTFGAVMASLVKEKAGQVRGPVQLTFGRSIDTVVPREISITRVAVTNEKDADKQNTIGNKHIVPYGLYRQEGFISANLAQKVTGFSEDDLELLWQAIEHMFEEDRSAARGKMTLRELIIFKHECALGNAPAHKLFELVKVALRDGIETPRAYSDYMVSVDGAPEGVTVERRG
ncbi:MAG: type I-C CRISPR-associated protein Cas7/Csd2 [Oscillospiraceae bacterium]|jgi:CRISPR-associated protein Csd2|nr:type I-C CRISPR-associated protein Cas7/Csd2 [Oscillospiraceae bacterium]